MQSVSDATNKIACLHVIVCPIRSGQQTQKSIVCGDTVIREGDSDL